MQFRQRADRIGGALCPAYRLVLLGLDFCYVTADSVGMPRDVAVSSLIRLGQDIVPAVATR